MKKSILVVMILIVTQNFLFSQEIKYKDLATSKNGDYLSYLASDNAVYKIGDRIKIGIPTANKSFTYIYEGDGFIIPIDNLKSHASGYEMEIKRIMVIGNKRAGHSVTIKTKGLTVLSNYTISFENALETGEIKGIGKTSKEALEELKSAKDKLELNVITSEQYEKIKEDLIKYIK
jgi:hypothetical protein